jgi:hypothetical protein
VLHGNDVVKSYERLTIFTNEAKKRGWRVSDYSLSEVENSSLFGEESFFILKDYKVLTKKILERLGIYEGNLIIHNTGKIPAPSLKTISPSKVELFELPMLLWKFLDSMTVSGLHELIKTQAVEYVMAMIAWKFKQNYIKNPSEKNAKMILDLAEIDVKSKTGKSDLLLSLDILLSKK